MKRKSIGVGVKELFARKVTEEVHVKYSEDPK